VRPINLIPPEERGDKAAVRTGPIAYLLVGTLALGLAAVTMLVLASNTVSDHKAEVAELSQQEADARARAEQLAPFANFKTVEQQRAATVKSLADSRFDWERVMRELSLVIPGDVWLTELTGSVGGASTTTGDTSTSAATGTSSVSGPSLQIIGCAAGQESVAAFLASLRDIDGVTRVGLTSSERPTGESAASSDSGEGAGNSECRTRDPIAKFEIVAAFDEVPTPQVPGAAPAAPTATEPAAPAAPATDQAAPSTETTPASSVEGS
jgi:Tfp pilus assembly protein PilN